MKTPLEVVSEAMSDYTIERIIEIIRLLEARDMTQEERMVRIAAHDAIENRHPEIGAILDSRIDEDLSYTDLVVDVLRNLGHLNGVTS